MKKIRIVAVCLSLLLLTGCVDQSAPKESGQAAERATEQKETENQQESGERIVATSVATCEILDKLGIDSVVGVPHTDSYTIPKRYEDAVSIGSPMAPDMEVVASLKPTLIISPNSLQGELEPQYDNIGVESYFLDLKSTEGMYRSIEELGEKLNATENAKALVDEYERSEERR